MPPSDAPAGKCGAAGDGLAAGPGASRGRSDDDTAQWLLELGGAGLVRELALARLHALLLRVARSELRRREGRHPITGPELDDLAHQAADDALLAVRPNWAVPRGEPVHDLGVQVRGAGGLSKLGRHFWQRPAATLDAGQWDQLPDRLGCGPMSWPRTLDLLAALRRAVKEDLTERQRRVFTAIVVDGVPLDALVAQLGSSRNAIYKTMFDARRKLRAALAANGYLAAPARWSGRPGLGEAIVMTGWPELEAFLRTDPRDVGCDQALRILHVYVDLVLSDTAEAAARRYPGVAAHLLACGPCAEDYDGLLRPLRRPRSDRPSPGAHGTRRPNGRHTSRGSRAGPGTARNQRQGARNDQSTDHRRPRRSHAGDQSSHAARQGHGCVQPEQAEWPPGACRPGRCRDRPARHRSARPARGSHHFVRASPAAVRRTGLLPRCVVPDGSIALSAYQADLLP